MTQSRRSCVVARCGYFNVIAATANATPMEIQAATKTIRTQASVRLPPAIGTRRGLEVVPAARKGSGKRRFMSGRCQGLQRLFNYPEVTSLQGPRRLRSTCWSRWRTKATDGLSPPGPHRAGQLDGSNPDRIAQTGRNGREAERRGAHLGRPRRRRGLPYSASTRLSASLLTPTRAVDYAQRVAGEGSGRPGRVAVAAEATGMATCGVPRPRRG